MPKIYWKHSERGGWFAIDKYGNYWHRTANLEQVTITTPEGKTVFGWAPDIAWKALQEEA